MGGLKKVHFDALRKDETTWHGAATQLDTLAKAANGIDVYRAAFSFAGGDVADTYAQLRTQVIGLLGDGSKKAEGAADALHDIRTSLEANEHAAVAEFGGMWTPKDI
ncbi:hypothetical protein [Microbacterium sp. 22242]|uniref:hypothetical protein n=1 Tax=Microbacterium sp. 22242 TaxID=3453896 RepID=UPI003F848A0E